MEKIKKLINYWCKIFKKSLSSAAKSLDIRGNIIIGVIWGFLLLFISWLISGDLMNYEFIQTIVGDLQGEIRVIAMLIIVFGILIVFNLFYIPAKFHDDQEIEIKILEENLNLIKKRISRKNIIPVWPPKICVNNNQIELYIPIRNDSGKELRSYYTLINRIGFSENDNGEINTIDIPCKLSLRWPNDSGTIVYRNMDKAISPGDIAYVSIVKTHTNFFKLDTIQSIQNKFEKKGFYYIEFVVAGVVDNIGIKNCIKVKLKYKGGNNINILNVSDFDCEENNV